MGKSNKFRGRCDVLIGSCSYVERDIFEKKLFQLARFERHGEREIFVPYKMRFTEIKERFAKLEPRVNLLFDAIQLRESSLESRKFGIILQRGAPIIHQRIKTICRRARLAVNGHSGANKIEKKNDANRKQKYPQKLASRS